MGGRKRNERAALIRAIGMLVVCLFVICRPGNLSLQVQAEENIQQESGSNASGLTGMSDDPSMAREKVRGCMELTARTLQEEARRFAQIAVARNQEQGVEIPEETGWLWEGASVDDTEPGAYSGSGDAVEVLTAAENGEAGAGEETAGENAGGGEDPGYETGSPNLDDWPYLNYYMSINSDVIGYIYVPGTYVDYPILRSQDWEDPDYYLMHRIDYSYGYPGAIYMQNYNSADFSDPMTILYGHNMYDWYTMFSSLHYLRDPGYLEAYHYIYVYTPSATYVYDIFAVYPFDSRHILFMYNFWDPNQMQAYLDNEVFTPWDYRAVYRNVGVNGYSKILTLSTCMFTDERDLRFLVQGVLVSVEH